MHAYIRKWPWSPLLFLLLSCLVYLMLANFDNQEGRWVLAVSAFAVLFWSFEPIPIYATSLWVVIFLTFFLSPTSIRADLFFSGFSNPLILLFFGGFILAAAVKKHEIDQIIFNRVIHLVGCNSHVLLATILFLSAFFSMWISNTAATAIMLALSKPLFESLSSKDPMRKALPLAVAFGTNIGGMGTPIGTPPNAIVLGILREYGTNISFFNWMVMAVPLVILILAFTFLIFLYLFPPKTKTIKVSLQKPPKLSSKGIQTALIAILMIALWLTGSVHGFSETWVALLGVGLFVSTGLISIHDLKNIDWDILLLMWGGLALGSGIENSKILTPLSSVLVGTHELTVIAGFCLVALILSTFISNTATANMLLPFAVGIASFETKLIAIPVALCCSLAMSLPVSTPPNALAYSWGSFSTKEMSQAGLPIAIGSLLIILAGFKWMIPWTI